MAMNKILYIIGLLFTLVTTSVAQRSVQGVIKNDRGEKFSGVKVAELGQPSNYAITDKDGFFTLQVNGEYLEVTLADVLYKRVEAADKLVEIILSQEKDRVGDLYYVKKTEQNSTQSFAVIGSEFLEKNATSSTRIQSALFGLLPGLHATQSAGWDGYASFNVRGTGAPLLIVDGFARSMSDIPLEGIESVQVLKDGAATALYGDMGASGVLLITTKRGRYNSFDIDVNYRHGFDFPINRPRMADAYTYAMAQNEALRNDGLPEKCYSEAVLNDLKEGKYNDLYANTNWIEEGTRDMSENNQLNVILRGGGQRVRYMAWLDYKNMFGLLNEKYTRYSDRYNSQMRRYVLDLCVNLDVDITSSTKLRFNTFGLINESKQPLAGIDAVYQNMYKVPAIAFPIKTQNGNWASNTMFKMNPLAVIGDAGYQQSNERLLYTDLRLTQDLSMFLKGLSAELVVAYDNSATFSEKGSKSYLYEVNYLSEDGALVSNTYNENTNLQISESKLSSQYMRFNWDAKLRYNRNFGKHVLDATAMFSQYMSETLNISESKYRQNIMGVLSYNYADRYMVDLVANCQGNSRLLEGDKYRLYPAVSAGWNLANEAFMGSFKQLNLLKIRASYGKSAWDNLSYGLDDHFYVGGGAYPFGDSMTNVNGFREQKLPMSILNPQTSDKYNIGVDVRLWDGFTATAEAFYEKRTNIQVADNVTSGMIGISLPNSLIGEQAYRGVELSAGWNKWHKDFNYYANVNAAWFDSEVIENGEGYKPYEYLSAKGHKVGQLFGLEAIGYFSDENDILTSPEHTFSEVRPGDVKYKDQNKDGKIDSEDRVAIGNSTSIPEMILGLNMGFEYKGFGIDMAFNGVFGLSKQLNVANVHQVLRNGNTNISSWYLEDRIRWTEETKDIANVPRLSTLSNANNYQTSTQWLEDGSFFKLRNLRLHYTLPQKWTEKMMMDKLQVYVKAQNVFSIDKIKYMNCEDLSLGYPDLFSLSLGVNINF